MSVPFCDLNRLYSEQKPELEAAVSAATRSGHYILGENLAKFESKLAHSLDSSGFAVGCNSGTDALILALKALGVRVGDEIITVSHTAIPTISAICAVGARPVFVDINPDTWLMDVSEISRVVTSKTRGVIAVHLYGTLAPISPIRDVLRATARPDIFVIEDVAQAHGATWEGRPAGTLGDLGCYSFYPTKNIGALGDAGAVFCQSDSLRQSLRALRHYGQGDRYHATTPGGINSRLDEVQAAVLSIRLPRLTEWNERKAVMMNRYRSELSGVPLRFQDVALGVTPAWHLCVIRTESVAAREKLRVHLEKLGVHTLVHYPIPTHLQPAFSEFRPEEPLTVTERLTSEILSLPLNPCLTSGEQDEVIHGVRSFYGS